MPKHSDPFVPFLGREMCARRESKGLSQSRLAKMSGVTPVTVSRIESGQRGSLRTLRELCEVMDVRFSDVIASAEDEFYRSRQAP